MDSRHKKLPRQDTKKGSRLFTPLADAHPVISDAVVRTPTKPVILNEEALEPPSNKK